MDAAYRTVDRQVITLDPRNWPAWLEESEGSSILIKGSCSLGRSVYRLIDPGSEWRLHRHRYEHSALGDLLGEDFSLAAKDNLYRCLDPVWCHRDQRSRRDTIVPVPPT